MHVDNFNPDSYLWILQECDVPYVPEEWNKLLASYGKDRSKLTGTTIVGRYLSKMKLKQLQLPLSLSFLRCHGVKNNPLHAYMLLSSGHCN